MLFSVHRDWRPHLIAFKVIKSVFSCKSLPRLVGTRSVAIGRNDALFVSYLVE